MNIDSFELELIDFQSCNTYQQKCFDARQLLEQIEIYHLEGDVVKNADNEILLYLLRNNKLKKQKKNKICNFIFIISKYNFL